MIEDKFNDLETNRVQALEALATLAGNIANADDYGDMLGALRLTELAAKTARRSIICEARAAGDTWQDIGGALGLTAREAQVHYE